MKYLGGKYLPAVIKGGVNTPQGPVYSAIYQAYLNRLTANSVAKPSDARKLKDDAFMIAMRDAVSGNILSKLFMLQMWCQELKSQIVFDWIQNAANPNYEDYLKGDFINSGGIMAANIGYNPNGAEPVASNFVPSVNCPDSINDFEFIVHIVDNTIGGSSVFGVSGDGLYAWIRYQEAFNNCAVKLFTTFESPYFGANDSSGFWAFKKTNNYIAIKRNDVLVYSSDKTNSALSGELLLATAHLFGTSNRKHGMFAASKLLTDAQDTAFYNAYTTYYNGL